MEQISTNFNSSKETVITNQAITAQWAFVLWLWDKGADPMKTGGVGVFEGEVNVAFLGARFYR